MAATDPFFEDVNRYFDPPADLTDHPTGLLDQIRACNSVVHSSLPLERDDGTAVAVRPWPSGTPPSSPAKRTGWT